MSSPNTGTNVQGIRFAGRARFFFRDLTVTASGRRKPGDSEPRKRTSLTQIASGSVAGRRRPAAGPGAAGRALPLAEPGWPGAAPLGVPGALVGEEGESVTDGLRADEAHGPLVAGRAEQALAVPEYDRVDEHAELVDQVVLH
jgi:hypothetical protein